MSIDGVVDDIDFRPDEPFEKWFVRIVQHFIPLLEPFEFFGFFGPEPLQIVAGEFGQLSQSLALAWAMTSCEG